MSRQFRRNVLGGAVVAATAMLSGCGGSSAFCDAVNDDLAASAVVFNPVLPGYDSGAVSRQARLSFMDGVGEAPEGLEEEWVVFTEYLEAYDPDVFVPESDEVTSARMALSDAASGCRD